MNSAPIEATLCFGCKRALRWVHGAPTSEQAHFPQLLLRDGREPRYVKALPIEMIAQVLSPIDLTPWIALAEMALTVPALALIIELRPRPVVLDPVRKARSGGSTSGPVPAAPEKPRS